MLEFTTLRALTLTMPMRLHGCPFLYKSCALWSCLPYLASVPGPLCCVPPGPPKGIACKPSPKGIPCNVSPSGIACKASPKELPAKPHLKELPAMPLLRNSL